MCAGDIFVLETIAGATSTVNIDYVARSAEAGYGASTLLATKSGPSSGEEVIL
jgi:hypothetical protein